MIERHCTASSGTGRRTEIANKERAWSDSSTCFSLSLYIAGNGFFGLKEHAPFDAIHCGAGTSVACVWQLGGWYMRAWSAFLV